MTSTKNSNDLINDDLIKKRMSECSICDWLLYAKLLTFKNNLRVEVRIWKYLTIRKGSAHEPEYTQSLQKSKELFCDSLAFLLRVLFSK